jgi:hypothetical protein
MSNESIIAEFKRRDDLSCDMYKPFFKEAATDYNFYANKQWEDTDLRILNEEKRPHVTFNQAAKVVDTVVGSQITNRYDIKYLARTPDPTRETVSKLMTETVRYVRERSRASHHETKAFWDMVVCGLGCIEIYQDYESDPDGVTIIKRVSPFYMRPDPDAREVNLRDKRYVIRRAWVSEDDFRFMWPEAYEKLDKKAQDISSRPDSPNVSIQRIAGYNAKDSGFYNKKKGEYLVNDYQWYERASWWRIQNPLTGELIEAHSSQNKNDAIRLIAEEAAMRGTFIQDSFEDQFVAKLPKKVYKRAFICDDVVLSVEELRTGGFTYNFLTGFEDHTEQSTQWFGLMRAMRDPQRYTNKFFSQMVYIMASAAKSGYFYEDGTFENENEARRLFAQPNSLIKLLPGGANKLIERQGARFPTGLESLMEHSMNAIPNVTGVNLFLQGLQGGSEPGVVVQSYQQQGMTILSVLFDSFQQYQEDIGDAYLAFIREYMPDGMIVRINNEKGGEQIVSYAKATAFQKYDIVVTQSPSSPNMQREFWDMMTQTNLLGQLIDLGYPVPPSIFNYMPLPDQFRQDWMKEIELQRQMEMQQMMAAAGDPAAAMQQAV